MQLFGNSEQLQMIKKYNVSYYNLDMIIFLVYRIKSVIATRFRQWVDFTKPEDEETFRMQNEMMYKKMEQEEIPFISWTISVSCKKIAGSIDVLEQSVKRKPYYGMVIKYLINSINKSIAIDD